VYDDSWRKSCGTTGLQLVILQHFLFLHILNNKQKHRKCFLFLNYKQPFYTWGSCFTSAMGATTEFILSERVCLASSGTIGSRPGLSCRPRIVAGWLPVPLPLKETFFSSSVFSVLEAFSPYKMKHVKDITVKPVLSRTHIKQTHSTSWHQIESLHFLLTVIV